MVNVRTNCEGHFVRYVEEGQKVRKGDLMGKLTVPCTKTVNQVFIAPVDGIVVHVHEETMVEQYTTVITLVVYQSK